MVEAVRSGRSHHDVAREFDVSPSTVHHWVHHAYGQRLDRVDWSERSRVPHTTQRTDATIEDLVLEVRRQLQTTCDLGFHVPPPSVRPWKPAGSRRPPRCGPSTVSCGGEAPSTATSGCAGRHRRSDGYLPPVAARRHELDNLDIIEGLVIKGGPQVEVLNGVSLHGGLVASWPVPASVTAKLVVECLVEHWREFGLPGSAQFDNDTIFQGTHAHPDAVGRVSRLGLGLGVVPVFVPPRCRVSRRLSSGTTVPGRRRSSPGSSTRT